MEIHKAHKQRIYPTQQQQKQLAKQFGCNRFIYNHYLEQKTKQYKETKKSFSFLEMARDLTQLQKTHPWLKEASRSSKTSTLRNLDQAYQNFYKQAKTKNKTQNTKRKNNYPTYKTKHSQQSITIPPPFTKIQNNTIRIPNIGWIKCELHLPEQYKLIQITISKTPTNKYYAAINIKTTIPDPIIDTTKPEIGIDFGLKNFITWTTDESNGTTQHPKPYKKHHKQLKRLQRKQSKRKKGSNKRKAIRRKIARKHEKITNIRRDFHHKLSTKLVRENQAIYLEDLSIEGMKARYGKSCNEAGWGEFTRQLTYKGLWYGCYVGKIDRFFPSSKTCNNCGSINESLSLKDRMWNCSCGAVHDRDVNAARNILAYGRADRNQRTGRAGVGNPLSELSKQKAC